MTQHRDSIAVYLVILHDEKAFEGNHHLYLRPPGVARRKPNTRANALDTEEKGFSSTRKQNTITTKMSMSQAHCSAVWN
jgi:hypothetical protein